MPTSQSIQFAQQGAGALREWRRSVGEYTTTQCVLQALSNAMFPLRSARGNGEVSNTLVSQPSQKAFCQL